MGFTIDRIIPNVYDVLLLGLALFKWSQYWRLDGFQSSRLVATLIKDQIFYFFV